MADRGDQAGVADEADKYGTLAPARPLRPETMETLAPSSPAGVAAGETPPTDMYATMAREIPAGAAGATVASMPPVGPAVAGLPFDHVGEYDILDKIGHGGMGLVLKARQRRLKRIVALKLIKVGQLAEEQEVARFLVEARAAAQLKHPNIVAVYDVGEHDGSPFFTMEYVEGQSLHKLISERPLQPQRAAIIIRKLALAVGYAHEAGILHRDLKPQNILLDKYEEPKITDFGLATNAQENSQLTATGTVLGTPSYMPPEQARGKHEEMGKWSDVYSLGATLYETLVGRPPFTAATLGETLQQVMTVDPVSLRSLNPAIPRDLETICLKCLEKSPARRYQTGQELADELQRFLDDRPILARPTSRTEKFVRWCRRNPFIAGSIAAVSVAAMFAILSLWIGLSKATAALNEADETNEEQFDMIDGLLLRISQETLLNQPGTQEVRADIQAQALKKYEKLLSKLERNQRLPLQIAKVRTLMGKLKGDLDAPEQALALFESAESALSKIKETDPDNQAMLKVLSDAQTERGGLLYRKHASEEATGPLQNALENRRRLVELDPGNVEWGALLVNAEMNLGLVEEMNGHMPQALEQYLAADRRRKELLVQEPANVLLLRGKGQSLRNLGGFYGRDGNLAEAEKSLEQSRTTFQKLCDLPKPDPEDLKDLATTWKLLGNIAMVRDTDKDLAIAGDRYAAAVKVTDELLSRNTAVHSYWELLVQSQMNLALVRERQKKGSEAFAYLKAAFEVAREERAINTTFSTIYAKTLYEMLRMRKWKKLTNEEDSLLNSLIANATEDYGNAWMKKLESDAEGAAEYPPAKTLEEFDNLESPPRGSGGKEKSDGK